MTEQSTFWLKRALWCLIIGFVGWSIFYGVEMVRLIQDETSYYCGNTVIDPLMSLLNRGSPIGTIGAFGLIGLSVKGAGSLGRALLGLTFTLIATTGLAIFGAWFFAVPLDGFSTLSKNVWWLI